jgi:hypothetical protein
MVLLDIFQGGTGRYSYHWQQGSNRYRFNNAPHYDQAEVEPAPHHLHIPQTESVQSSFVRSVSREDITAVLQFVNQSLSS